MSLTRRGALVNALVLALAAALGPAPAGAADGHRDYTVAVVPSDDAALSDPVPRDGELTPIQVEQMVRRAVDLLGGMAAVVPDTARLVVLKINIGLPWAARSGVVTDDRVARAVALLVHEAAPRAAIRIAEAGGGWTLPENRAHNPVDIPDEMYVDAFALAGHRATVDELRGRGIDIDCLDLNLDAVYTLTPPGGGLAAPSYDVAASILDADVWINLPVAKTHGAKITCAMKNHFGLLPGRSYGWTRASGTPWHPPMPHTAAIVDEAFVDLWLVTDVDLNVVDLLRGSENGPFSDTSRQANIVLAGRNPVATDLVAARLMGFNPDDLEFADLAWQRGRGPGWIDSVEVRGADPATMVQRWHKAWPWYHEDLDWFEQSTYGMGPRRWTLLGPLPRGHAFSPAQRTALRPTPGRDGWSPVTWFGHDKIDLDAFYQDPAHCAVYGFVEFTMPQADAVRYWLGADERLQVWVDGEAVYDTDAHPELSRRRRHRLGMIRVPGWLDAGPHRLLVRAEQSRGDFGFSVNICEPIDDPRIAGNTYPGLRYTPGRQAAQVTATHPVAPDRSP